MQAGTVVIRFIFVFFPKYIYHSAFCFLSSHILIPARGLSFSRHFLLDRGWMYYFLRAGGQEAKVSYGEGASPRVRLFDILLYLGGASERPALLC